jgi:uncharacterized protein with HEPN domain
MWNGTLSVSRDFRLFLDDIRNSCLKIVHYAADLDRDVVFADSMRFEAILFNLHVIGEAVKQLPEDLKSQHRKIPWREIAGLRDFVAHAYFALDLDILWNVIQQSIPTLLDRVDALIEDRDR